jgi:hypothetical protein
MAVDGAARPPAEERPSNLCGLISWIVDDNRRTRNAAILTVIIGCIFVAATRGVHVHPDQWRALVHGSALGYSLTAITGATVTYAVAAVKKVRERRHAAAASVIVDVATPTPGTAAAVGPSAVASAPGQSHTPAPPAVTPSPQQQPRRRSGRPRKRRSSARPQQPSP